MSHPQSAAVRWLLGQLRLHGVDWLLVCPGSRSTPLVQAAVEIEAEGYWRIEVVADERQAGFAALGLARVGRHPAVLTTSGSAVAHLLPACVEAGETATALLLLTADRPPALRDCGAPQTVRQPLLLASYARVVDLDVSGGVTADQASQAQIGLKHWQCGGLVHLNVCLDTPLALQSDAAVPWAGERNSASPLAASPMETSLRDRAIVGLPTCELRSSIAPPALGERVIVIVGPLPCHATLAEWMPQLCARGLVLAEWPSQLAAAAASSGAPRTYDALLRDPGLLERLRPDRIVRVGEWPASKGLQLLLEQARPLGIAVHAAWGARRSDPLHHVDLATYERPEVALAEWCNSADPGVEKWRSLWFAADSAARAAAESVPAQHWELGAVRTLVANLAANTNVIVGNSMAVRDLDALNLHPRHCARIVCSRGANGIDGTLAMAWGAAIGTAAPTRAYLGDCTFLHDIGSLQLIATHHRQLDLRVLVIDNDGGAIFDYLPARSAMAPQTHERLFTAQHGLDLVKIARGFGLDAQRVTTEAELRQAWTCPGQGVRVVIFQVDRATSFQLHRQWQGAQIGAAVAALAQLEPC